MFDPFNKERRMAALEDVWVSQASAKQRRGRAGRVQPGLAVHLFPKDASLAEHQEPEVSSVSGEVVKVSRND